jgi:hypothetical protein
VTVFRATAVIRDVEQRLALHEGRYNPKLLFFPQAIRIEQNA